MKRNRNEWFAPGHTLIKVEGTTKNSAISNIEPSAKSKPPQKLRPSICNTRSYGRVTQGSKQSHTQAIPTSVSPLSDAQPEDPVPST